jgi:serine/threonine protein kinase
MHSSFQYPLAHLDVKSPNILITGIIPLVCKITDFGTSRFVNKPITGMGRTRGKEGQKEGRAKEGQGMDKRGMRGGSFCLK